MSNIKWFRADGGYLMEYQDKKVFLKQKYNEDFYRSYFYEEKMWGIEENSQKEIELTEKEWGQAVIYISILREKHLSGVICTLLEWFWGEEKIINARKSLFWQLRDNCFR